MPLGSYGFLDGQWDKKRLCHGMLHISQEDLNFVVYYSSFPCMASIRKLGWKGGREPKGRGGIRGAPTAVCWITSIGNPYWLGLLTALQLFQKPWSCLWFILCLQGIKGGLSIRFPIPRLYLFLASPCFFPYWGQTSFQFNSWVFSWYS